MVDINYEVSVGNTMLAECTGVCLECPDPNTARFLTSLSLFTASDGKRNSSDRVRVGAANLSLPLSLILCALIVQCNRRRSVLSLHADSSTVPKWSSRQWAVSVL